MDQRLKYKTRHHKTPRREYKQNILWHKLYQRFLRSVSQGNRVKRQNTNSQSLYSTENMLYIRARQKAGAGDDHNTRRAVLLQRMGTQLSVMLHFLRLRDTAWQGALMENFDGTFGVVEGEAGNLLTTALSCFSESLWRVSTGAGAGILQRTWGAPLLQAVPRTPPSWVSRICRHLAGCPVLQQFRPAGLSCFPNLYRGHSSFLGQVQSFY